MGLLLAAYVIVCLLLLVAVLMQRPKQEGLGAAFGGGVTDSVFGAQTSEILTKVTIWLTALFFLMSMLLAYLYAHRRGTSAVGDALSQPAAMQSAPAKTAEPGKPAPSPAQP